ncbi:MAG: response regulator transcription factor [Bacteroidales bacterium]|nr:response regulator transcription factor [Bacteroidales bacterium]
MKKGIKVCIVDDHALFREGLKYLLDASELVSAVFEAKDGREFLENVEGFDPDIVLMDIDMPEMNGIEATKLALNRMPLLKILALSMYSDENFYAEMIEAGAKGFLIKNSGFDEVQMAITEIFAGRHYFSPEILTSIVEGLHRTNEFHDNELSEREKEVLVLICQGLSNHEIGEKLFISKRTVDKHRENILFKTESKNTAELVVFAIRNRYFVI